MPFGRKTLFTIYASQVDSSLHPKFYFRTILEVNSNSLLWVEFIVGKFIFSLNFFHYERWHLHNYKDTRLTGTGEHPEWSMLLYNSVTNKEILNA